MELTSDNVTEVTKACLYQDGEVTSEDEIPEGSVVVAGILNSFAFHPERLESHREDVRSMLNQLPGEFIDGGGWSFLNMCLRKDGEQWTGLHLVQERLAALIIGLGYGAWFPPTRDSWGVMPGGLPYLVVSKEAKDAQSQEQAERN